jgi:hypothetical protein
MACRHRRPDRTDTPPTEMQLELSQYKNSGNLLSRLTVWNIPGLYRALFSDVVTSGRVLRRRR